MSKWKNSIVSYIDLIGIQEMADQGGSAATDAMRKMHSLVEGIMNNEMKNHDHCYLWNDSVLLLSYLDSPYRPNISENEILEEVDSLKKKIDSICQSYAIAVMGRIFPEEFPPQPAVFNGQIGEQPRTIKLKASSYAMGNCFKIEAQLGSELKKPWYIDSRIASKLDTKQDCEKHPVRMLPKREERDIHVYEGYLW